MFRWEKQEGGAWYAYSGQVVIGMAVPLAVRRDDGRNFVWHLSAVRGSWAKTCGHTTSMPSAKSAVKRCWTHWCEVHGLSYEKRLAGVAGLEPATTGFGDRCSST